jgi:hypothetical protein
MTSEVSSGLIAAGVSLVGSLLTYLISGRQISSERHKLEREMQRKFTERLYEIRIKTYPAAFAFTEMVAKPNGVLPEEMFARHLEIRQKLRAWKSAEVTFLLSNSSFEAFRDLERRLKKNPDKGNHYSPDQLNRLWHSRNRFRSELRRDVGLLFDEEEEPD